MKSILQSRTFWIAVAQAIISVAVVVFTELDMLGVVFILKSIVDIILRVDTKEPIR